MSGNGSGKPADPEQEYRAPTADDADKTRPNNSKYYPEQRPQNA
jgi:hypothetical protein